VSITRVYRRDLVQPVDFYVGYYESQRTGRLIPSAQLSAWSGMATDRVEADRIACRRRRGTRRSPNEMSA
jgi:hypothetical protein